MNKKGASLAIIFLWVSAFICGFADTPFLAIGFYQMKQGVEQRHLNHFDTVNDSFLFLNNIYGKDDFRTGSVKLKEHSGKKASFLLNKNNSTYGEKYKRFYRRQLIDKIRDDSLGFYQYEGTSMCLYFSSNKKWLELCSGMAVFFSFGFIAVLYGKSFSKVSLVWCPYFTFN